MNWVDLIIVVSVGLALWSGLARGALLQVFSWGGFFAGLILGSIIAPPIVNAINPDDVTTKAFLGLGVFLGIAFLFEALVAAVGLTVRKKITRIGARKVDQVLGGIIGVFFALIGAWFLGSTLKRGPSPTLARAFKDSTILRAMDEVFPRPPAVLAEIGRFLDQSGFPDVFAQLNPSLAPGVEPPPASLARDAEILAAAEGTYKIESIGCGGVVDGSGFPLDDRHVITAAHVVAGTSGHRVIDPEGRSIRGNVVFINTDIDIAVIRLTAAPDHILEMTTRPAARREDGAAIGYPGGGPRSISVARVRALTEAVGRDIYNRKLVSREVYVLAARVRQGNSGGPFVDEDGVVRGMIFAASADDPNEAYALSADEIDRAYDAARARNGERVGTGSCAL
ncbi:MAG TPA: MarP family serine protease [Actinomycetota bacterium]|nr:MarP family serine protease [Actinomycetota bacterium]